MSIPRTVCLGFLAMISLGTLLLMLPFATSSGNWNDPIVALFTATSAVCVTGLVVVDTGSYFSFWGQLFIMLLIQIGGLGYMTTTTFLILLAGRRFDLRQRFALQEVFDRPFLQGSQNLVRSIIATALVFELTGFFLLLPVFSETPNPIWYALFHSISAWNNAGFALYRDSLVIYRASILANLVFSGLIIFGGLGYQAIMEIYSWLLGMAERNRSKFTFSLSFKVVTSTTILLLILGAISFFLTMMGNPEIAPELSFKERILAAWFQSVTTRTAGFNTVDIATLSTAALFISIGLMFVGASPGGTGGGIKTTTLRVLVGCTRAVLQGKNEVIFYERRMPVTVVLRAVGVVFGSIMIVVLALVAIALLETQFSFIDVLFEVVSAFATVGLSTGITASLSTSVKLILILTMYIGRVGVLIFMGAILGEPRPSVVQYPEENLLVG